jgi:hypothetical protein
LATPNTVLGTREILVRIRIPGSVPYLRLMDPDPNCFFIDSKDGKKKFSYFFLELSHSHHLQSIKYNFLLKFCVKILFCRHYFSPLNTFMRKGKGSDPNPYL